MARRSGLTDSNNCETIQKQCGITAARFQAWIP